MSNKNTTPLELYVIAYLRQNGRKQIGKNFVRKALALVDEKLGVPCCVDPGSSIQFYTRFDNDFTNTVRAMVLSLPKRGNKQALNRVHRILYKYLNPPCCV